MGQKGGRVERLGARVGSQVVVSALTMLFFLFPAQAAVFNIAAGDVAALISAISTANGNNQDDTINLAAGTYTLTAVDNETDGPNGLPSITGTLTLHGAGAESTMLARTDTAPEFCILHVAPTGALTVQGLTVTGASRGGILNGGTLALFDSTVRDNFDSDFLAGGILNNGTMTLLDSTIAGNFSDNTGGILNRGTLTVVNSTISGNGGNGIAGGILNAQGIVTLINSTIS